MKPVQHIRALQSSFPVIHRLAVVFLFFCFTQSGNLFAQVTAGDCNTAVNVCTNQNFQISPNGFGSVNELGIGTVSNPLVNPASGNMGCLMTGEQNSTWVIINIAQTGTLEFSFGSPGPVQCYDWAMWRYNSSTCSQIFNNTLAPVRCNWNSPCNSFTGMATTIPAGGLSTNFEPPLPVQCGEQYLICFSNYSSAVTSVPLNFFGTGQVTCQTTNLMTLMASPPQICQGNSSTLTATGGSNYTWSPSTGLSSTTGPVVTATPTATTTYTVTGQNGCGVVSQSIVVTVIPAPVISVSTTIPTVCQPCNGAALATVTGANPPILYSWSPAGGNGPAANNLCPGTYTLTVNGGGCIRSQIFILPEPYLILGDMSYTAADCGVNNGTATITNITGAVSPYTITWNTNPVQTTNTATGLAAGGYMVTIRDVNNCRKDTFITVQLNSNLTSTFANTPLSCPNGMDATASVTPSLGTPPYTVTWNTVPVQTGLQATGLAAGQYTATIRDNANCTIYRNVNIARPPGLTLSSTYNPVSCHNASDGALSVVPANSSGPYQYAWSTTPVQSTQIATGVSPGTYVVTVTDGPGCWERDTVILINPPALSPTVTFTQPSCFGGINGTATVQIPPNLLNISFFWNTTPVQTAQTAVGLSAGTYKVVVVNRTGCTDSALVNITSPARLSINYTHAPATCLGSSNGTATLQVSGGTGPYTYSWQTQPVQNTVTATGLSGGTWRVVVQDARLCTDSTDVFVTELPDSIPLVFNITPVLCPGDSNGSATVQIPNGNGIFQYTWFTVPVQNTQTATALGEGTIQVRVQNPAGCIGRAVVNITSIPPMILNPVPTEVSCHGGSDGQAGVLVTQGSPGYSYVWNTLPVQTTQNATGLSVGTWRVIVRDINTCADTLDVVVTQPPLLQVSGTATPATCYGRRDGTAVSVGMGGVAPYQYSWNTTPVQSTQNATGLYAGLYTVTILDQRNCISSAQVVVQQPGDIIVNTQYTMPLCYQSSDGQITATASGGNGPYTYTWNHGPTGPVVTGLSTGTWGVTVRDVNGCTAVGSRFLPEPAELMLQMSGIDLTCAQPPDNGIVSVFVSGGSAPYTYLWNGGQQITQAWNTGVPAGTWTVVVHDRNNCTKTDSVSIIAPVPPVAHTLADTFKCAGTGMVPISGWGSGGVAPYTYLWTPNNGSLSDAFTASPLANPDSTTTYFLQVVDSAGCRSALVPQKVTVHPLPIADAGQDIWYCKDGPAAFLQGSVVDPQGSYTIQWLPVQDVFCPNCLTTYASPDTSTIYTLRVTSLLTGCSSDSTTLNTLSSVLVEVRPRPVADAGPDTTVCFGDMVSLCGIATGAGPDYDYFWAPAVYLNPANTQCVQGIPPYSNQLYLVVESNGCQSPADSVEVFVSALPVVDAGNIKNICAGDSIVLDGSIQQGIAQQYQWTPVNGLNSSQILTPTASPAVSQWYYLRGINTVCPGLWDSVQVIVHDVPIAEAGTDTVICSGNGAAVLNGNYTGGSQPVSIRWYPQNGLSAVNIQNPVANPSVSTMYYFETESGTGNTRCITKDSVMIQVAAGVQAVLSADTSVLCSGTSVRMEAGGGQGSQTYAWYPQSGISGSGAVVMAHPDTSTWYSVIVSEGACSDTAEYFVAVHPRPGAGFIHSQPEGCREMRVIFNDRSAYGYSYTWDFGDGSAFSNEINPEHTYVKSGDFRVRLILTGPGGCKDTAYSEVDIRLREGIEALAISSPPAPVELVMPVHSIHFESTSPQADKWLWNMGDGNFSDQKSLEHMYAAPGTYYVTLEVTDASECSGNTRLGPFIIREPALNIPNVFSPNGDGIQDKFYVEYDGDELFLLQIYDRWGVLQHESRNKHQGWDGKDLNGNEVAEGTYFYHVSAGGSAYSSYVVLVR